MNNMKLVTFKAHTEERIGALIGDKVLDLTSAYAVYLKEAEGKENASILARGLIPPSMKGFLTGGEEAMEAAKTTLEYMKGKPSDKEGLDGESLWLELDDIRLEAPVPSPGKLYCTAVNFYDHATERIKDPEARAAEIERLKGLKLDVPDVFQKPPGLVVGPRGPLIKVKATDRMDYECELAIVIGKRGKYISKEKAYDHIAGYTILIDVSARDQGFPQDVDFRMFKNDVNWTKGKGMDSGGPMGPCILTRDEVPDPYDPPMKLITRVNGETRQNGDLSTMIIGIPRLVEYLSNGTTLEPGDIIATGTVAGVAHSWPDGYIDVGDVLECEIPPIGSLKYKIVGE
jgi:acylpyruvate hydrolase